VPNRTAAFVALLTLAAVSSLAAFIPNSRALRSAETPSPRRGVVAVSPADMVFKRLNATHQRMIERLTSAGSPSVSGVATCFTPGTDDEVIAAFNAALAARDGERFNQTGRWAGTALSPAGGQGDPVILTYSFVPDGTAVPDGVGEGAGVSNLVAYLNGIYGSPAVWQPLYAQIFSRWSELSGITYVYEPNDDGAPMFDNPGVAGVRGDLRMAGKFIDGNSGVLAYNFFPQSGDMVIDTGDNFYFDLSNSSRRLRNVLAHEHGHGMGQLHVCPITQTKLMEPTVATGYDGPRHDDIRNAQRHYGDPFEPDDSPAAATDLGTLSEGAPLILGPTPLPDIPNGSLLSIDANAEQDYFRFDIAAAQRISVTVTPIGLNYDDADQACTGQQASCCSGAFTNSLLIADLAIQVLDSDGSTVLATAAAGALGQAESIIEALLPDAGVYYIRVYETNVPSQSQLYHLSIQILDSFLGPRFTLPSGAPDIIPAGVPTVFNVDLAPNDDTIVGTPSLFYRFGAGAYIAAPLTPVAGTLYTATIPAPLCTSTPQFYLASEGASAGPVTLPAAGAASPFSAVVGNDVVVADFNFETAADWTVTNSVGLVDGPWDRGVPVNCDRGDPTSDFDGSGQCFLTDNSSASACNSDVDDGSTTLVSPIFDISALPDPVLSYARWYSNTFGASPQADVFTVEVSSNGGSSWTTLEVVGPTGVSANPEVNGGWFQKSFFIADFVPLTNQFRVRFTAADVAPGSVIEAGIDAFSIRGLTCAFTPANCPGDANFDNQVDFEDINTVIANWLAAYTPGTGPGDSNGDGLVNFEDINASIAFWLQSCE
jgi:hypothetical protein